MSVVAAVVSIVLALVLVMSGYAKLTHNPTVDQGMTAVGVPLDRIWMLAVLEFAGAAGLVAGIFWWPIGAAAAVGVILYFVGALLFHARAHDKAVAAPAGLLAVAVAALVLGVVA